MTRTMLDGKSALVLAGSTGIGLATAKSLYDGGANVFLNSRSIVKLRLARKKILRGRRTGMGKIYLVPFDMNVKKEVDRALSRILKQSKRGVEILVLNTGVLHHAAFLESSEADWDKAILHKFKALYRIVNRLLPSMVKNKKGRIIHIGSVYTKEPKFGYLLSNSARLLMTGYLKSLADHVALKGIGVNQVLCGYVATERLLSHFEEIARIKKMSMEEVESRVRKDIPMGRFALPDEIGRVVRFLCSDEASYITGQSIVVDGGLIRTAL